MKRKFKPVVNQPKAPTLIRDITKTNKKTTCC